MVLNIFWLTKSQEVSENVSQHCENAQATLTGNLRKLREANSIPTFPSTPLARKRIQKADAEDSKNIIGPSDQPKGNNRIGNISKNDSDRIQYRNTSLFIRFCSSSSLNKIMSLFISQYL